MVSGTGRWSEREAILWGGLAVGVLDAAAAMTLAGLRGVSPDRVWQHVASGVLGRGSFSGGLPTAALGLVVHFLIAFTATAVYVVASRWVPLLARRPYLCGPAYGVAVYFFMQYLVVPLSLIRQGPFSLRGLLQGLAVHVLVVGLPISLSARRARGV
jgi:hypothetical protein